MKRILLKLSGEALAGDKHHGFDEPTVTVVAKQVKQLVDAGVQVGIVIGGGNFWRGRTSETIDRTKADQIGMLATIMNCIYVSEIFRSVGMQTQILTPFECGSMTKLFSKDRANKYFEKGMVVFFAGKVILLSIVEGVFIFLWSMLFVIPGIIAVYRYSFAIWNLCQNPELGVMEALNRSKRQTIGYKGQLFGLHLSFIGWYLIVFVIVGVYEGVILALMPDSFLGIMLGSLILTVLTGVVDIYLTPYFALSECGFYLRATAPEEPPRQDRSSYTPEF